eukprot:m51a1_g1869 hypothetical protein (702) ;mRNA; r:659610-661880
MTNDGFTVVQHRKHSSRAAPAAPAAPPARQPSKTSKPAPAPAPAARPPAQAPSQQPAPSRPAGRGAQAQQTRRDPLPAQQLSVGAARAGGRGAGAAGEGARAAQAGAARGQAQYTCPGAAAAAASAGGEGEFTQVVARKRCRERRGSGEARPSAPQRPARRERRPEAPARALIPGDVPAPAVKRSASAPAAEPPAAAQQQQQQQQQRALSDTASSLGAREEEEFTTVGGRRGAKPRATAAERKQRQQRAAQREREARAARERQRAAQAAIPGDVPARPARQAAAATAVVAPAVQRGLPRISDGSDEGSDEVDEGAGFTPVVRKKDRGCRAPEATGGRQEGSVSRSKSAPLRKQRQQQQQQQEAALLAVVGDVPAGGRGRRAKSTALSPGPSPAPEAPLQPLQQQSPRPRERQTDEDGFEMVSERHVVRAPRKKARKAPAPQKPKAKPRLAQPKARAVLAQGTGSHQQARVVVRRVLPVRVRPVQPAQPKIKRKKSPKAPTPPACPALDPEALRERLAAAGVLFRPLTTRGGLLESTWQSLHNAVEPDILQPLREKQSMGRDTIRRILEQDRLWKRTKTHLMNFKHEITKYIVSFKPHDVDSVGDPKPRQKLLETLEAHANRLRILMLGPAYLAIPPEAYRGLQFECTGEQFDALRGYRCMSDAASYDATLTPQRVAELGEAERRAVFEASVPIKVFYTNSV